jgi:hypothetical protein
MAETELQSVPSTADKKQADANCGPWIKNQSHFNVALVFAAIGIAAAVGLGSGDWYTMEASAFLNPNSTVAGQFPVPVGSPLFPRVAVTDIGSVFVTAYYGLRMGYVCNGPQTHISFGTNVASQGAGQQLCAPFTYRSKLVAFQNLHDQVTDSTTQQRAFDAITAYNHLLGSSGIIVALLALCVVICGLQFLGSASVAFGHADARFNRLGGRAALVIAVIIEALVLIFWITIFPYNYFYGQEPLLMWGAPYSYDVYHSIGVGFSIQIGGLLVGLAGLLAYPADADAVVMKQGARV